MEGTWLRVKRAIALLLCVIVMSLEFGSNTFAYDTTEENLILLDDRNISSSTEYSGDKGWKGISYTYGSWTGNTSSVGLLANTSDMTNMNFAIIWNNYGNSFKNGYSKEGSKAYRVVSGAQDNFENALKYSYYIYQPGGVKVKRNNKNAKVSNPTKVEVWLNQDDPLDSGFVAGLIELSEYVQDKALSKEQVKTAASIIAVYLNFLSDLDNSSISSLRSAYDMGNDVPLTLIRNDETAGSQAEGFQLRCTNRWQLFLKHDNSSISGVVMCLKARLNDGTFTQEIQLPGLYEVIREYCTVYQQDADLPIEKYSNIRQLYSFIESIVNPSKEEQNGNEYDSARDVIKEWIAKADETGDAIDCYWVNAMYYVLTGKPYLLSDPVFRQYDITEIDNSNELSAEEKLRIKTYIKVALNNTDFESRESGVQALPIATGNEQLFSAAPNVDTIRSKIQSVLSTDYAMYTDAESAYVSERTALSMIDNAYGLAVYLSG